MLYQLTNTYAQAEPSQRALAINEKAVGQEHPTQRHLDNLALLYQTAGAYAQAEPLHRRALTSTRKRSVQIT